MAQEKDSTKLIMTVVRNSILLFILSTLIIKIIVKSLTYDYDDD